MPAAATSRRMAAPACPARRPHLRSGEQPRERGAHDPTVSRTSGAAMKGMWSTFACRASTRDATGTDSNSLKKTPLQGRAPDFWSILRDAGALRAAGWPIGQVAPRPFPAVVEPGCRRRNAPVLIVSPAATSGRDRGRAWSGSSNVKGGAAARRSTDGDLPLVGFDQPFCSGQARAPSRGLSS